jgi:uncharacterized membrane protein
VGAIKNLGWILLGLVAFVGLIFLGAVFVHGAVLGRVRGERAHTVS